MSKQRHRKRPELQCSIGDKVFSQKYGNGVVIGVNPRDHEFRYNVAFEDGTKVWYDGRSTTVTERVAA